MKAFLSHSSEDKEFVRAVSHELGRQFCILDEQAFSSAVEFKKSIEDGLDESSIFVFFCSKAALKSVYVNFEIEEAWYKRLEGKIKKALVYIIDSSVDLDKLPEWLKRGKIITATIPKTIARDIRYHLNEFLLERQHPLFFNRDKEKEELADALRPIDTSEPPPRVVFIHGLPGYGRRSFVRNRVPELLNLRKFVYFKIGTGDSINDICTVVADEIEPYSTMDGLRQIVAEIQTLNEDDALERLENNLKNIVANGELPIFVDEGGLLDYDGYLQETIQKLLSAIPPNEDIYLCFISSRKPKFSTEYYPLVNVRRLPDKDTKRIISDLARENALELSFREIDELSKYTAGYPPAAIYAIREAKEYGVNAVLKAKEILIKYRTNVFMKHVADAQLSDTEKSFLSILSFFSPLPVDTIIDALSLSDTKAVEAIIRLIDFSFVTTTTEGHYQIAEPITEVVSKLFGMPTEQQMKDIATSLSKYLSDNELEIKRLDVSRVLFRVARLSNNKEAEKVSIHLSNDLIRLTVNSYHNRKYDEAIAFGKAAVDQRPRDITARAFLIRALIKKEKWREAEEELNLFAEYAPLREALFIRGFYERNRNEHSAALKAYLDAEKRGRYGVDIKREIATCHLHLRNIDEADKAIKIILKGRNVDNPYIVDLWVQIALEKDDPKEIKAALDHLKLVDECRYYFRLSRFNGFNNSFSKALTAIRSAIELERRPPFKFLAQEVYCLIKTSAIDEARRALTMLDTKFGDIQHDIRLSLRCKLEIASNHHKEALRFSDKMENKNNKYYMKIRLDALEGELMTSSLSDAVRILYKTEVTSIKNALSSMNRYDSLPID